MTLPPRKHTLAVVAVLLAAGIITYANSFSGPFVFDGIASIRDNPNIQSLWPIWDTVSAPPGSTVAGRPVLAVSLALNYQLSGLEVWSYHIFNLVFHLLSALLLFCILRRTFLSESLKARFGKSSTHLSLAASLLWLLHPLHTNAVTYINQRAESLMGMFYLLTFYCALRALTSDGTRRWTVAAVAACALGVGAKEAMATAPLLVLLYDRIFISSSFKELFRRRWPLYAGLFATWALVLLSVLSGARNASGFGLGWSPIQYAVTQCYVIAFVYLKLAFWPTPLIFDYGALAAKPLSECILPGIVILLLLAATALAFRYRPKLGFLGAWFFLILAPTSSLMPIITQVAVEYRMYLSLAAVVVLVVLGAHFLLTRLFKSSRWKLATGAICCLLAAGALGLSTHLRNRDYQSAVTLWTDTIEKAPQSPRALLNRGVTHAELRKRKEAVADFTRALGLDPNITTAYLNRARIYLEVKQPQLAQEDLEEFIRLKPEVAEAYNLRGMARGMTADHEGAIADFDRAIALDPDHAEAHANRGIAYANRHDFDRALPDLKRSIHLNPNDYRPHLSLAATLKHLRHARKAVPHYREVLRLNPKHALAQNDLAFILATHPNPKVRNGEEAVRMAEEACRLTKNSNFRALETLAAAYAEAGRFEEAIETAEKAEKMAESRGKTAATTRIGVQLGLYRKNIPYRKQQ